MKGDKAVFPECSRSQTCWQEDTCVLPWPKGIGVFLPQCLAFWFLIDDNLAVGLLLFAFRPKFLPFQRKPYGRFTRVWIFPLGNSDSDPSNILLALRGFSLSSVLLQLLSSPYCTWSVLAHLILLPLKKKKKSISERWPGDLWGSFQACSDVSGVDLLLCD